MTGTGNGDPLTTGYSDYGSIGQYSFVGTIVDPGVLPSLSIGNASAAEGGALSFTVSLSEAASGTVTVDYSTADGSATAGSDYSGASGTLTFLAGETSKTITVNSLQDSSFEGNESFSVNLSNASGAALADGQGDGTIIDDDPEPLPTVSIGDASANEGKLNTKGRNAGTPQYTDMTFTVTLSAASSQTVTVNYATADETATVANNDYQAASGTVTFNPGETSKSITLTIVGDNDTEPDETFNVTLSGASGADIGDGTGVGTIVNDDGGGGNGGGKGGGGGGGGGKGKNKAAVVNDGPTVAFPSKYDQSDSSDRDEIEVSSVPVQTVAQAIVSTDQGDHSTDDSDNGHLREEVRDRSTDESSTDEAFIETGVLLDALATM